MIKIHTLFDWVSNVLFYNFKTISIKKKKIVIILQVHGLFLFFVIIQYIMVRYLVFGEKKKKGKSFWK